MEGLFPIINLGGNSDSDTIEILNHYYRKSVSGVEHELNVALKPQALLTEEKQEVRETQSGKRVGGSYPVATQLKRSTLNGPLAAKAPVDPQSTFYGPQAGLDPGEPTTQADICAVGLGPKAQAANSSSVKVIREA